VALDHWLEGESEKIGLDRKALKYSNINQINGPMVNIWPTNGRRNGPNGCFLAVGSSALVDAWSLTEHTPPSIKKRIMNIMSLLSNND
jgi:hypothetical protein